MADPSMHSSRKISAVWLIPLFALLIGLWLAYRHLSSFGPVITLHMERADGITAGKTPIKIRNVQVGLVEEVSLSDDLSHTILRVQMIPETESMFNQETRFWVVKPRIGKGGISGLSTVLSGSYIELEPGDSSTLKKQFTVHDTPPAVDPDNALFLRLTSTPGSNINNGDPVSFQNLKVGQVIETSFDPASKLFRHRLFIEKPYDVLVTRNTRFWKVSGVGFQLDASGFQAQINSIEALLGGGISFAVPDSNMLPGEPAIDETEFMLHDDKEAARQSLYTETAKFVVLVKNSIRGLSNGAPVEYRGIRIGTVEQAPWTLGFEGTQGLGQQPIPVLIRFEPQRLNNGAVVDPRHWHEEFERLVNHGLRASLKVGNMLTGSLYVDLKFHEDAPQADLTARHQSIPVFPSVDGGSLEKIEEQIHQLLVSLNDVPVQEIANHINENLENLNAITRRVEVLLADPAMSQLPQLLTDNLKALEGTLEGWQSDGEGQQHLIGTLEKLNHLLNEAEPLIDTLNQQPNALIFQRHTAEDLQPRGAQ